MLNHTKPKQFNGKTLNGDMLADLIDSYITAINRGVVPSIESAWNYICVNECKNAFSDALEMYERILLSGIGNRFPLVDFELKICHKEAKEAAFDQFSERAMGAEKPEYFKQLQAQITKKFQILKEDNEIERKEMIMQFLEENYHIIRSKIDANDYKTYGDFI